MRVLVTLGGTREPIDSVRFIGNLSTGKTGALICDHLAGQGIEVMAVCGPGSEVPHEAWKRASFGCFSELYHILEKSLGTEDFDVVIHLAAVSDFSVDRVVIGSESFTPGQIEKIGSSEPISLSLKTNFKIIERLKSLSKNKNLTVVGFKLTNTRNQKKREAETLKLSLSPNVDYVVHNDLNEISETFHKTTIYRKKHVVLEGETKRQLAENLHKIMRGVPCA